jgi:prepilin-type processing-associated H-X9-DG protein
VNNLKQIGLAMHNYVSSNDCLPPAAITDANGRPLLSWRVAILPYIEEVSLYNQFHLDEPWDSPHNLPLASQMPRVYACPSNPTQPAPGQAQTAPGQTTYRVIVGPHTIFPVDKAVRFAEVTDGLSNTILVGETRGGVTWSAPDDLPFDPNAWAMGFGSFHAGGFNVLFADGSVKFIKLTVNPKTLEALTTRDGGEVIDSSSY